MCGIAGIWTESRGLDIRGVATRMIDALHHRGPDGQNVWLHSSAGLALAHARLAIVDLSPAGTQPMVSASGRYTIVLNGEIYNHATLRRQLEQQGKVQTAWRGHSDTETLLAAIEAWGLAQAVQASTGMFAIALWDREQGTLSFVRDRFGEKPLYYAVTPDGLIFGSELKALMTTGMLSKRLSRDAAAAFLRFNNIPGTQTVFEGVHKLMPGHLVTFGAPGDRPESVQYWSVIAAWQHGRAQPFKGSDQDAVQALERHLERVLHDQMLADVPLGAFLSGGVDSSIIVALMQAQAAQPVRTFSIGFSVPEYNEAEAAKAVARHLGTDHTELYVSPSDALALVPKLPTMYCEPFADSSQLPTHLVARMARANVTVALSGDAGDEVFGGYNRYQFGPTVERRLMQLPSAVRGSISNVIRCLPEREWDRAFDIIGAIVPPKWRATHMGHKLYKVGRALSADNREQLYRSFVSQWEHPCQIVANSAERFEVPDWAALNLTGLGFAEQMMIQDAVGYLPNDILTKVDRASMAVSLECRAPFLDHQLYEFAASLPLRHKIRDGVTKWLVRQVLYKHVAKELIERPKVGFGVPIEHWLRVELRDWAEDLISADALRRVGIFDVARVREAWDRHVSGRWNLQHQLWCILMYQAWYFEHVG
jgi:asparagine synthase (glutamine-hydrolysing)